MYKFIVALLLLFPVTSFAQDKPVPLPKMQVTEKKEQLAIFMVDWCTPCQAVKSKMAASPRVQSVLKTKYLNQVLRVDVDKEKTLAKSFGVTVYPTLIIYKVEGDKNVELRRLEGNVDIATLLNFLAPNVKHIDLTPRRY